MNISVELFPFNVAPAALTFNLLFGCIVNFELDRVSLMTEVVLVLSLVIASSDRSPIVNESRKRIKTCATFTDGCSIRVTLVSSPISNDLMESATVPTLPVKPLLEVIFTTFLLPNKSFVVRRPSKTAPT